MCRSFSKCFFLFKWKLTQVHSGTDDISRFWRSCLGSLMHLLTKLLKLFGFPIFRFYSRNVSCVQNVISMFLLYSNYSNPTALFAMYIFENFCLQTFLSFLFLFCLQNEWCIRCLNV